MEPLIKGEGLKLIYNLGKSNEMSALDGVRFQIYPGEFIIIFGPSGCGKSTLLNIIAGLQVPTAGRIIVAGQDLTTLDPEGLAQFHQRKVGMIFQAYNLLTSLSVLDNVALPRVFLGDPKKKRVDLAMKLLSKMGVKEHAFRLPQELSGGQQQRVGIARALINNPLVILADEPIGNLDSVAARNVMDILNELNEREKRTIILVTHETSWLDYAQRVFHMRDGRIVRVTVNAHKKQIAPVKERVSETRELEQLAQSYPTLTQTQLIAKFLANFLISDYETEEIHKLESIIESRLLGKINREEFRDILDASTKEGGLGLYRQRAKNFSQRIEKVIAQADEMRSSAKEKPLPSLTPLDKLTTRVRRYLLDSYQGSFEREEELERLDQTIAQRLAGKISRKQFEKILDCPFKEGGVGLNRKTAKAFARKIEVVLVTSRAKNNN